VGVKNSLEAAKIFRSPYELAIADEMGWIKVPKIGAKLARSIVKEIHGSD